MKTIFLTIFTVFCLASSAFAVNDLTDDGALEIGGATDSNGVATNSLIIGLSPRVTARYFTDGTNETAAQWYAIATLHPGGNVGYGTAQDVNNVFMRSYDAGAAVTTVTNTIPVTSDPQEGTVEVDGVVTPVAAATWTNNGWSLTAPTN